MPIPDLGKDIEIAPILVVIDLVIKVAVDQRRVGKQAAVEKMVPPERAGAIAPIDAGYICLAEYVPAEVSGQVKMILIAERIIYLGIDIIEVKLALPESGIR